MKFPYRVVYAGKLYLAGEDVPEEEQTTEQKEETVETVEEVFEEPKEEPVTEEKFPYGKNQINRMSTSDLKEIAKKFGITDFETKTGAILKKELIEKFGL